MTVRIRGVLYRDEDDAYAARVQRELDDAAEVLAWFDNSAFKPTAAELSLQQALTEGQRAAIAGREASENPYDHHTPEYAEWNRGHAGVRGMAA